MDLVLRNSPTTMGIQLAVEAQGSGSARIEAGDLPTCRTVVNMMVAMTVRGEKRKLTEMEEGGVERTRKIYTIQEIEDKRLAALERREIIQSCRSVINKVVALTIREEKQEQRRKWEEEGRAKFHRKILEQQEDVLLVEALENAEYNNEGTSGSNINEDDCVPGDTITKSLRLDDVLVDYEIRTNIPELEDRDRASTSRDIRAGTLADAAVVEHAMLRRSSRKTTIPKRLK